MEAFIVTQKKKYRFGWVWVEVNNGTIYILGKISLQLFSKIGNKVKLGICICNAFKKQICKTYKTPEQVIVAQFVL